MLLLMAACIPGRQAKTSFSGGLAALEEARAEDAFAELEQVRRYCGTSPLAQQAVLVEAAAALGGRAGSRDPQRAAVLSAAFLRQPRPPAWGVPVAESLYLLSQELGARTPSREATSPVFGSEDGEEESGRPMVDCRARWDPASEPRSEVPSLDGEGMATELQQLRIRLDELEKEVERLRELLRTPDSGGP